jgi:eukaryotic-like serine/threonine-protein kinase
MTRDLNSSPPIVGLPPVGEVIGESYRIDHYMRAGRMGVVAAATRVADGERFALKFLRPELAEHERSVERFLREARAAHAIMSEHIARVIDVGKLDDGAPFMVMEHVEGIDLRKLLAQDGPLSVEDAVDYALQAAEAVAEAHALGIVHRDLKPSNLLLSRRADGSPLIKVIDFGVAKIMEDPDMQKKLTTTGKIVGSPFYWSPEQIRDSRDVDGRTDVWGLGNVLYEFLTGHPPFRSKSLMSIVAKIIGDPHTSVHEKRADVPLGLAAVLDRCLEKERSDRYQTLTSLAEALTPFAPDRSRPCVERIAAIAT